MGRRSRRTPTSDPARGTTRLFRRAGETAGERGLEAITADCFEASVETTDKETVLEKLTALPLDQMNVLAAATGRRQGGEIVQPATTRESVDYGQRDDQPDAATLGARTVRSLAAALETMRVADTDAVAVPIEGVLRASVDPSGRGAARGHAATVVRLRASRK